MRNVRPVTENVGGYTARDWKKKRVRKKTREKKEQMISSMLLAGGERGPILIKVHCGKITNEQLHSEQGPKTKKGRKEKRGGGGRISSPKTRRPREKD